MDKEQTSAPPKISIVQPGEVPGKDHPLGDRAGVPVSGVCVMSEPMDLIVQYYRCADAARQAEIDECLRQNLRNPHITTIHLLTEEAFDFASFPGVGKIRQTVIGERLTFERAFRYANEADPDGREIWILANADIYFDDTLRLVERKNLEGVVYALTRYDVLADGSIQLVLPEFAHGCQDAWIFQPPVPLEAMFTEFPLGIIGCDHRIAYEFTEAGRAVANPCLSIIACHLDTSQQKDIHTKTEEYSTWMNEEGYRLGKVVSPPYLYCLYPSKQLAYPDSALLRQHVVAASKAFLRENELLGLMNEERGQAEAQIEGLKQFITSLEQKIAALDREIDRKSQLLNEQEMRNGVQADRIAALENSLSWRVTKPLRTVGDLVAKASPELDTTGSSERTSAIKRINGALAKHDATHATILLLDFNLGGGSNLYSRNLISHLEASGKRVVTLAYRYGSRNYQLSTTDEESIAEASISGELSSFFQEVVQQLAVEMVIVSQLVSWPNTSNVLEEIAKAGIPYTVLLHDYFLICPNWTLFDYQDKFCGIPDKLSVCATCLGNLRELDIPLIQHTKKPQIKPWRKAAEAFLRDATKVVCFSDASLQLARKAFPSLNNLLVNEHSIPAPEHFTWQERTYNPEHPLTIAVVGEILRAKGSTFLDRLLHSAELRILPVRIVLIGSIRPQSVEEVHDKAFFVQHGPYVRAELGDLLERYDASVVLIPSLWPETFCFTASEALLLGYPVLCFDLGAQAERVRRFDCGWVIREPYQEGVVAVLQDILAHPGIIQEKSKLTRNYLPTLPEEHFLTIMKANAD